MFATALIHFSYLLLAFGWSARLVEAQTQAIDCQRPPQLIDPAHCCRDGGRDQVTEKCAARVGVNVQQANGVPPSMHAATCLAECILTESRYIQEPQKLNLPTIRSDLSAKFSNDSAYVEAMAAAYAKCEPHAKSRLAALQQFQFANPQAPAQNQQQPPQLPCSPFPAMLLGCTYMEYFKNCPAHRWTQSAECELAKAYVTQCTLAS